MARNDENLIQAEPNQTCLRQYKWNTPYFNISQNVERCTDGNIQTLSTNIVSNESIFIITKIAFSIQSLFVLSDQRCTKRQILRKTSIVANRKKKKENTYKNPNHSRCPLTPCFFQNHIQDGRNHCS